MPETNNLKEERFILAHGFKVSVHVQLGPLLYQKGMVARKQRTGKMLRGRGQGPNIVPKVVLHDPLLSTRPLLLLSPSNHAVKL